MTQKLDSGAPFLVYLRAQRSFGRADRLDPLRISVHLNDEKKNILLEGTYFHYEDSTTIYEYSERGRTKYAQLVPQFGEVVVYGTREPEPPRFSTYDDFIRRLKRDM